MWSLQSEKLASRFLFLIIVAMAAVAYFIPILWLLNNLGPPAASWLEQITVEATDRVGDGATILIALLLGVIAYSIREWARPWYAIVEIFFGIYGTGTTLLLLYRPGLLPDPIGKLAGTTSHFSQYLGFISFLYVTVRGLDNLISWLTKMAATPPHINQTRTKLHKSSSDAWPLL